MKLGLKFRRQKETKLQRFNLFLYAMDLPYSDARSQVDIGQ
jgi:hypothetical protein